MASKANRTTIPTRTQDTITQNTILNGISAEVKTELLAFGILRNRLHEIRAAVAARQTSIIKKLSGTKLDNAFLEELRIEHNQRAARIRGAAAVRA